MNEMQHMMFAWLCMEDYAFWGCGDKGQPVPCLLVNDIFVRGADAEQLNPVQVEIAHDIAKKDGMDGLIAWVAKLRGTPALQQPK